MGNILDTVIHCNVLDDEARFRELLEGWVAAGELPALKAFTHESKTKQTARQRKAREEARAAEQALKEIQAKSRPAAGATGPGDLFALIQQKNAARMSQAIRAQEEKYAGGSRKRSTQAELSEEEFQAIQQRLAAKKNTKSPPKAAAAPKRRKISAKEK